MVANYGLISGRYDIRMMSHIFWALTAGAGKCFWGKERKN